MYTILMLNQKGGVGKTTIADELSFAPVSYTHLTLPTIA